MPNIDIDVDINLQKAFALPSCADIFGRFLTAWSAGKLH